MTLLVSLSLPEKQTIILIYLDFLLASLTISVILLTFLAIFGSMNEVSVLKCTQDFVFMRI